MLLQSNNFHMRYSNFADPIVETLSLLNVTVCKLMMLIKSINWLSKDICEAEIAISDGKYNCLAFSCHHKIKVGDKLVYPLRAINCKDVMIFYDKLFSIKQIQMGKFEHEIIGNLVNKRQQIVSVGEILISLDCLPSDVKEGDFIQFQCGRLDAVPYPLRK